MNLIIIKVAELFGAFKPMQDFLRGKKTIISAIAGIFGSIATIAMPTFSWIDGKIDINAYIDQIKVPALTLWVSITFLWAAMHPKNIAHKETLGPAR